MHTLYRFYDLAGTLLYVGITNNPPRRFTSHRVEKDWWRDIARIDLQQYDSRSDLAKAERDAIETERPLHNITFNETRAGAKRVAWRCDECQEPIADGHGYLTICFADIAEYQQLTEQWERDHTVHGPGLRSWSGMSLPTLPERPVWRSLHGTCDPNPVSNDYWIDVERIRTLEQVIHWTAHLLDKPWLTDTEWASVLYRIADGRDSG